MLMSVRNTVRGEHWKAPENLRKDCRERRRKYVFTAICVATRYVFFRSCISRDAPYLATIMLDVLPDCGVIPGIIQSDNEFCNMSFEELCISLGTHHIFSTALRLQSQGIVERVHRDV